MGHANLCRGPELNWRHMVLQTIALPTELPRRGPHFTRKLAHELNVRLTLVREPCASEDNDLGQPSPTALKPLR